MKINPIINAKIIDNNNIITTSEVCDLGFSKTILTNYVKAGLLERIRHGTYIVRGCIHDDMYTLMLRSNKIVFSHDTAAFLNGISNRKPFEYSVTLPRGISLPNSLRNECKCYYIKQELYEIGLIEKKTSFGNMVKTYSPERTVCDILRSRSRLDEETVIDIVKNYFNSKSKDLNQLSSISRVFKVDEILRRYTEVLL